MRICLITPELSPHTLGGIATYVEALARGYAQRGHKVTVAGYEIHPKPRVEHDWGESFSLTSRLPVGWMFVNGPMVWRLHHYYPAAKIARGALAVRKFLKTWRGEFDIVELSNWPGHGAFLPRGRWKTVVRLSTPAADCGFPVSSFSTWYEGRACRFADMVVAHSEAVLQKATTLYGLESRPSTVVPLGIPDVSISKLGSGPGHDTLRLVYLGRAEDRKGTDLLIRALAEVMPAHPELRLTVVGGDFDVYAQSRPEVQGLWSTLRATCGGRIELLGKISEEEKVRVLGSSHWLVMPSRYESFGLVAIEAMRVGTPVIASDAGGLGEVCRQSIGNLSFPSGDAVGLRDALELACEIGPEQVLMRRDATRSVFLERFRDDLMIDRSLSHYEALLDGSAHAGVFATSTVGSMVLGVGPRSLS